MTTVTMQYENRYGTGKSYKYSLVGFCNRFCLFPDDVIAVVRAGLSFYMAQNDVLWVRGAGTLPDVSLGTTARRKHKRGEVDDLAPISFW